MGRFFRGSQTLGRSAWAIAEDAGQASDESLLQLVRAGEDRALDELMVRYRPFARARARGYFLAGADLDDVVQEGLIGLYKAIRDFDPTCGSSFRTFAELCITRQMITAVKTATRQKHTPLNSAVSLSRPVDGEPELGEERVLADTLSGPRSRDPAELVVSAERIRALQAYLDEALSDLEVEVLRLYVDGRSYAEIAEVLSRHTKSIDNALQRVKRKLEEHLRERQAAEAG